MARILKQAVKPKTYLILAVTLALLGFVAIYSLAGPELPIGEEALAPLDEVEGVSLPRYDGTVAGIRFTHPETLNAAFPPVRPCSNYAVISNGTATDLDFVYPSNIPFQFSSIPVSFQEKFGCSGKAYVVNHTKEYEVSEGNSISLTIEKVRLKKKGFPIDALATQVTTGKLLDKDAIFVEPELDQDELSDGILSYDQAEVIVVLNSTASEPVLLHLVSNGLPLSALKAIAELIG